MKRVAGIWDLSRSGGTLGTLLILLEILQIQRWIYGTDTFDVIVTGDVRQIVENGSAGPFDAPEASLNSGIGSATPLIPVMRAISGMGGLYVCSNRLAVEEARKLLRTGCIPWPKPEDLIRGEHDYDSTQVIRDYFAREKKIPRLSMDPVLVAWANGYLKKNARDRLPIAVHLKNNPAAARQSNANFQSWLAFMDHCQRKHEVHFVLVGDDLATAQLGRLPNVTIARKDGVTIERSLALIHVARFFMGMMSGPANMALFGTNPYLIFKNPDHHSREMALELGAGDRYPFALAHQRVLRIWDTPEHLVDAFENALGGVVETRS